VSRGNAPGVTAGEADLTSVAVLIRSADNAVKEIPWAAVNMEALGRAAPWRIFHWHGGQQHYSGAYWASTEARHVIYESRLELARLLLADFDKSVVHIVAQPFLLTATVDDVARRHVPDFLLLTESGPVVVDVKPLHRLANPKVSLALAWTRQVVQQHGWCYEVFTEPPQPEAANVRFLAGYRRSWLFERDLLDELRHVDLSAATLGEAFECLPARPAALVRSAVLHLLWRQEFLVDLARPLSRAHTLRRPP
jgi:hypothetical protein